MRAWGIERVRDRMHRPCGREERGMQSATRRSMTLHDTHVILVSGLTCEFVHRSR
jgi:hypothetical protein